MNTALVRDQELEVDSNLGAPPWFEKSRAGMGQGLGWTHMRDWEWEHRHIRSGQVLGLGLPSWVRS